MKIVGIHLCVVSDSDMIGADKKGGIYNMDENPNIPEEINAEITEASEVTEPVDVTESAEITEPIDVTGSETITEEAEVYAYDTNTAYHPCQQREQDTNPMTLGDWVLTLLASCLPCIGLFIYIYWAVSKETNVNRQNFCRAWLIVVGIGLVLWFVFCLIFGAAIVAYGF